MTITYPKHQMGEGLASILCSDNNASLLYYLCIRASLITTSPITSTHAAAAQAWAGLGDCNLTQIVAGRREPIFGCVFRICLSAVLGCVGREAARDYDRSDYLPSQPSTSFSIQ